jgi:protein-tyrosine phosphatase
MVKILFVCLGNICRSPLAEAIFLEKVKARGLHHQVFADSCGTSNYHIGDQPDHRTLRNALRNGIAIDHLARQFTSDDFENFDYILAMDRSNMAHIMIHDSVGTYSDKVQLALDFHPKNKGEEVPDPYFGGEEGFQQVFDLLDEGMSHFLLHLETHHGLNNKE